MFPEGEPVDYVLGEYEYGSDANEVGKWAKKFIFHLSAFLLKTSMVWFKGLLLSLF